MTIGSIYSCSSCSQVLSLLALASEYFFSSNLSNAEFSNKQLKKNENTIYESNNFPFEVITII